ncbi:hypothetical protein [Streptomyces goshikiensis]|uniref:hypothetical protein n=1 Tax=Streptomyces goshikiensis TaxID=1942 RepID=UPI00371C8CAF
MPADPVTRAGAVRHCALDAGTARWLAEDPDEEVRGQLAERPDLPSSLRDALAGRGPRLRPSGHPRVDPRRDPRAGILALAGL